MSTLPSRFFNLAETPIAVRVIEKPISSPETSEPSVSEPILQRVAAGDSKAIRECVDRYSGLIWSLARRMFNDRNDAEDAVQEVFIQLWRKAEQFDPAKASESTFIGVLARRRMIDLLRKKKRQSEEMVTEPPDFGSPDVDKLEQADELRVLREMWKDLVPEQQAVLSLSIYNGLSYSQIADELSIPIGTVKSRARTGLRHFATSIDPTHRSSRPWERRGHDVEWFFKFSGWWCARST